MFQSLCFDERSIVVVFDDGRTEELMKCPFPGCKLFHAASMKICPTTGRSINGERTQQAAQKEGAILASRAENDYLQKQRDRWQNRWPTQVGSVLLIAGLAGIFTGIYLTWGLLFLTGAVVMLFKQSAIDKKIKAQATEIFKAAYYNRMRSEPAAADRAESTAPLESTRH